MRNFTIAVSLVAAAASLARADAPRSSDTGTDMRKKLDVKSTAFAPDATIPAEYTCDGAEKNPPLTWSKAPSGTKSIALLVDDPDAPRGTFTHWMVANLPPTTMAIDADAKLPGSVLVARNDKGSTGYAGPCPPNGTHHYRFHVFALDTKLAQTPTSRDELMKAIDGHVLAEGLLVGTYQRQR